MIHFIVNPRAGSSRGIRTFRKLEPELGRYHLSYDVMFTQYPGHASGEARRIFLTETSPQIAVLGGDGTMHEVLEGIRAGHAQVQASAEATENGTSKNIHSEENPSAVSAAGSAEENAHVTLMFLPCGSGNDFARGLRLTKDPSEFARALSAFFSGKGNIPASDHPHFCKKKPARRKQLLSADGHFENGRPGATVPLRIRLHYGCGHAQGISQGFFVSGGMGFDSSVTEEIATSPLKPLANRLHLSTLAYLLLGIRQIIVEPQAPARIVVDDKKQLKTDRLFFLSAHKMRCEGGGFPFAPDADPASDTLSVCIFYGLSRPACAWALFLSLFGLHRCKRGVALLNCRKIEVFSQTFRSTHTDGEPLGFVDHVCFTAGEGAPKKFPEGSGSVCADKREKYSFGVGSPADVPIDFLVTKKDDTTALKSGVNG